jgi:hypothetical protein
MLSGNLKLEEFKSLVYTNPNNTTETLDRKEFEKLMSTVKRQIGNTGLPHPTLPDFDTP